MRKTLKVTAFGVAPERDAGHPACLEGSRRRRL